MFSIGKKIQAWKIKRRFPVRWMTYKKRVQIDVDHALKLPGAEQIFDYEFVEAVTHKIQKLEGWQIKLMTLSFAISAFLVVGFISNDASVSLFGISLKQVTGLKEILLAVSATIGVLMALFTQAKEPLISILQRLKELTTTDKTLLQFAMLSAPASFNLRVYLPREYDHWIFPTALTRCSTLFAGLLWLIVIFANFVFSIGLNLALAVQIYRQPTLGIWSTLILWYLAAALSLGLISTIKLHAPLPYSDQGDLKRIGELEKTNPAAAHALRKKYFGI